MEQLRLFWRLAKPYFTEAEGAKTGFALLLALTLLNSGVSVLFSYTSRDFYTALSSKDQSQFYVLTGRFALALAAATPVSVLYRFQRQRLAIAWREWMTMEVARQYYADRAYYQISLTKDIDNPDQRIAEDVKARRHAQSNSATRRATSASELAPRSQRAIARTITRTALHAGVHARLARFLHHAAHLDHRPRLILRDPLLDLPGPLLRHHRLRRYSSASAQSATRCSRPS